MAQTEARLDDKGTVSGSNTGVTANAYASALDWKTHLIKGHKSIVLKNTSPVKALKYKLLARAHYDSGTDDTLVAETVLGVAESAAFYLEQAYARLTLQVASNVADQPSTYQADYVGYAP